MATSVTCPVERGLYAAPSMWSKLLPLPFLFLLVQKVGKHLILSNLDRFWGVCNVFQCLWGYSRGKFPKSIFGNNFWLEWPTDLRSTPLSYIFNALFRDTPLGHVFCAQPNSQIAKYPNIWLIWLFGYLAARKKHGQVGYPWKEH